VSLLLFLNSQLITSWPGMKPSKHEVDHLDTGFVHTPCCTKNIRQDVSERPSDAYWPSQFTMHWDFYYIDFCHGEGTDCLLCKTETCQSPPYSKLPPKGPYNMSRGTTYTNFNFRGGSQKEVYYDRCLTIFQYYPDWPCEIMSITDEGQAYVINHGDYPKDVPECCIVAKPLHPPPRKFSDLMNYRGTKTRDGKQYHQFYLEVKEVPYEFNFLEGVLEHNGEKYHQPLYMITYGKYGEQDQQNYVYHEFHKLDPSTPDDSVFDVPASCRREDVGFCPGFDPSYVKKHHHHHHK